ncbi:hypothetical protein [Cellvibrio japonicus]|uniref:MalT-like TPR region domain-containing protein n=1 Tax=Cellvibrio japonicus (strain Ueda107) TaxID=498211 RepID=B3PBP2_CELJU|nr:hypothetical protein [Cellvibrio japonicus]ACE84408.1 conserved hypothetical protein [Cellvibrio japonicus Ueda107]QEI11714.1 hypothetical protein FY117_05370 [Cellvibrio japonicus]QEI15288.1 hypothetical protein FY116_05370 [Cellvibrio japonicus]QEI18868.1 hypothetical protein FY115_05370 [Cellvibrio japonicus]
MYDHVESPGDHQLALSAWKQAIQLGNQALTDKLMEKARINYQVALHMARAMARATSDWGTGISVLQTDRIMAAWVVTQHNLADLYVQIGLLGRAAEHLCDAHEFIFGLRNHPMDAVADLALRHLRITGMELMVFLQKYGDYPRISQTLWATQIPFSPLSPTQ